MPDSGKSRSSSPGMAAKSRRGAAVIRWAWARWQASWYVATSSIRPVGGIIPNASMNSLTSLTLAANFSRCGCKPSRQCRPYSFIIAPQPAWLTTTAS